jgi:hypothetical protein
MEYATTIGLIDHNPLDEIKVNFTLRYKDADSIIEK